ncbi:MAG: hydrogenobyrinic acid a,c-diamide synthase (glutamine-hydrolyzing) [Proteobacteria bacterium]|nr:hydrogenobyrinic acid a,c-diamide synthase (glutamine-hydrolyzing) [Pseudomonadota bacterium]MBU1057933.1 hydrogenobyrinic acid a,c-diamide synthase (glutamine-hydrolyzing) [Pseudomonadota bacterium]
MTKGIVVAGLSGGSGKSVVSVGLTAALARQGKVVVPFKKGPDYIDAGWLKLAAGKNCYNLDPYLMSMESIKNSFLEQSAGADVSILEGNRGLYDGVNPEGGYSTAELALTLKLPVLLVVNCTKTTRTVAAMVLGCLKLDERIDIRGVVLNQIGTKRHESVVTQAVETYTGVPVLGAVPRMKRDIFPMRHLGVTPHQEYEGSDEAMTLLADLAEKHLDMERIQEIMAPIAQPEVPSVPEVLGRKLRIGLLMDAAFQFYYSENLEALERGGAVLVAINAMDEKVLPELDGLYIGGGFPETSAGALAANQSFRDSVKAAVAAGLPIYAECGGLIYLGESIELEGEVHSLAGVFPIRFGMSKKPQAHGYSIFEADTKNPFYPLNVEVRGHEFRYSTILEWRGTSEELALKMKRGVGFIGGRDGLITKNVLALYTHVHALGTPEWAEGFLARCREVRDGGLPE